jgi:hypothetical protein
MASIGGFGLCAMAGLAANEACSEEEAGTVAGALEEKCALVTGAASGIGRAAGVASCRLERVVGFDIKPSAGVNKRRHELRCQTRRV